MNAKEYLEQIRELEHKIYCMKLRSEYYDKMSLSIPGPTYGEKIGSNPNRNTEAPFMKWLFKKDEIDREIGKLEEKLNSLKAEAIVKIETLENEELERINLNHMEVEREIYETFKMYFHKYLDLYINYNEPFIKKKH